MNAKTVVELVKFLIADHIDVVVDGGWGVDALLGEQTRPHNDLDIAIPHKDVPKLRKLLAEKGFAEMSRDDSRDCNFVLEDESKNQIDVHSYTFDEHGNNIYGVEYLPEHLTGKGIINDYQVKCIAPEWAVKFHTGYDLNENDLRMSKRYAKKF
jgi:lincosamide nucleotidyltransferase A/C/D/E